MVYTVGWRGKKKRWSLWEILFHNLIKNKTQKNCIPCPVLTFDHGVRPYSICTNLHSDAFFFFCLWSANHWCLPFLSTFLLLFFFHCTSFTSTNMNTFSVVANLHRLGMYSLELLQADNTLNSMLTAASRSLGRFSFSSAFYFKLSQIIILF